MHTIATRTIREIALESPATTRVFEEFKIDYCCGGRKSLEDACSTAGLDFGLVAEKIISVLDEGRSRKEDLDIESRSATELIDHIVSTHHVFTVSEIERLRPLMEKVCTRHGDRYPELAKLQDVFAALSDSLIPHMRKEEMVLFPYIRDLDRASAGNIAAPAPHFGTVANPIRMMMSDHEEDGKRLKAMREVSHEYTLPDDACPSFTALYSGLQDLEKDIHRHIHLENNLLFPAALDLERKCALPA